MTLKSVISGDCFIVTLRGSRDTLLLSPLLTLITIEHSWNSFFIQGLEALPTKWTGYFEKVAPPPLNINGDVVLEL